jgi:hypothetical protein
MRTIRRTIQLHSVQHAFRHSPALYRAFVGGRGAGKSFAGAYDLLRRARPNRTYLVGSPTGVIMGDTTFPRFEKLAKQFGVWSHVKLTPYPNVYIRAGGGLATVRFRTAEDPDRMRGPDLSGVWLDEASLMVEDVYNVCIASLREDGQQGFLTATFTPVGPTHWTYSVFATGRPDTALFRAPTRANPFNPPGFAATIAKQYGDSSFARQELGGEFVAMEGATFPAEWLSFPGFLCPAWPEGCTHEVLYLDPSQGRDSKSGDAQAFVRAGFWPGPKNENLIYLDCVVNKEPVTDMIARGVRLCKARRPALFAYETNGTLGFLEAEVDRQCRESGVLIRTMPITNRDPKLFRIRNTLMPYLAQGRVRIVDTPGGRQLKAELQDCPAAAHDDASDAAAGAVAALESLLSA